MHSNLVFVTPDDFDTATVASDAVHFAVRLRLPFRFRTGKLFRFLVTDEKPFQLWIYNRFQIPHGTGSFEWLKQFRATAGAGWAGLWSEAVVFIPDPFLKDDTVSAIQQGNGVVPSEQNLFRTLTALNEFICAYATGTNQIFGGAPLRMLTDMEFFQCLYAEITMLSHPSCEMTDKDIEDVFDWKPEREVMMKGGQLSGELDDLPPTSLDVLDLALQNTREHAFYEIAFKAKTEMVERDPIVAIVLACAALEGVHAAFLRHVTKGAIENHGLISDLLREQGFFTLIQVTPRLFMSENLRPPDDLVKRCADAITTRNHIMHAKMSKQGYYHFRRYTSNDLTSAYSALMEMYMLLLKFTFG